MGFSVLRHFCAILHSVLSFIHSCLFLFQSVIKKMKLGQRIPLGVETVATESCIRRGRDAVSFYFCLACSQMFVPMFIWFICMQLPLFNCLRVKSILNVATGLCVRYVYWLGEDYVTWCSKYNRFNRKKYLFLRFIFCTCTKIGIT